MSGYPGRRRVPRDQAVSVNKRFLFVLIGLFLVLAPASVSGAAEDSDLNLKWVRVGVLVLMTFVGLQWFRLPRFSELSGKVFLMACVFTVAALWSTAPLWGLLFKGMFVCAVCASVSLAYCVRTEPEFRSMSRTMTVFAVMAALLIGYLIFVAEYYMMWKGRLVVADMNANSMGLSAAIFALLSLFHLLIGDRPVWRFLNVVVIGVMMLLVVYSGSRAAVLTIAAGFLLLIPALGGTRQNAMGLAIISFLCLVTVGGIWFLTASEPEIESFESVEEEDPDDQLRLVQSMTKDTRLEIWTHVVDRWLTENPVQGAGWLHENNRWRLVQSSYLQVAAEAGLPGVFCVFLFLLSGATTLYRAMHLARVRTGFSSLQLYLFAATFFAVAFHGIFESAAVVGSSANAILLGFSAAQLDILLRRPVQRRGHAGSVGEYGSGRGPGPGPGRRPQMPPRGSLAGSQIPANGRHR